ncbi:hypothetical protein GGF38_002383, partial [Coemansia sp. RSA 25]
LQQFMTITQINRAFNMEVSKAISEEPFVKYAEQLKFLMLSGIPEGCETFSV